VKHGNEFVPHVSIAVWDRIPVVHPGDAGVVVVEELGYIRIVERDAALAWLLLSSDLDCLERLSGQGGR
jgi:hypothetical protein